MIYSENNFITTNNCYKVWLTEPKSLKGVAVGDWDGTCNKTAFEIAPSGAV